MATKITIGGQIKDALIRDLVTACTTLGYYAGLDAYRDHSYKHRTYALHDSYASAVYLDGLLVEDSIRYINRSRQRKGDSRAWRSSKTPEPKNPWEFGYYGRDSIKNYFEENRKISKKKGISIVVVAAQWYASMVESKGYKVLNPRNVASYITFRFDSYVTPVLQKHGLKKYAIDLKRELGSDQFYLQDQKWRNA